MPIFEKKCVLKLKNYRKQLGITILYVTHDQEIALAISDRLAIMNEHGDIQQIGTNHRTFTNVQKMR